MKKTVDKILRLLKSDSPRAVAENLPKSWAIFLLCAPAAIFFLAMAGELVKCFIMYNTFSLDIFRIHRDAAIVGLIGVIAYFLKLHYSGKRASLVWKNPTVILFGVLMVFMVLSTIRNGMTEDAFFGSFYRRESIYSFLLYPALYYFVSSLIGSETAKRRLIDLFLVVSALIAVPSLAYALAAKFGLAELASLTAVFGSNGIVGIYHQFNHYGYSLVIALSLSAAMYMAPRKRMVRLVYLAGFVLFSVVLAFNNTFGAFLAAFASLVFLLFVSVLQNRRPNPRVFLLMGLFLLLSLAVNFRAVQTNLSTLFTDVGNVVGDLQGSVPSQEADRAGTGRWQMWKATVEMIAQRPLLGYGVEGIGEALQARFYNDRPHNEFLQYAAFFGIPAMLAYAGAVLSVFISFLKRRREFPVCAMAALTAAFGYLVSSCFGNTMYYTAPLFFIVLGMADTRPPELTDTPPVTAAPGQTEGQ